MANTAFDRYRSIRAEIDTKLVAIGRPPESVRVIAVSKTHPVETMLSFLESAKQVNHPVLLGENYIQEFAEKFSKLPPEQDANYACHFIGHLQRNKAKDAVRMFSVIESVDSSALAEAINKTAGAIQKQQQVYLQVNISRDENKGGFLPEALVTFICDVVPNLTNITVTGLMTITALYDDPESARPDFRALRELSETMLQNPTIRHALGRSSLDLSMGMSADYLIAVEEGATVVRIGTAIFGERPKLQ